MADKEITDLTSGGVAQAGDKAHVVRSGNSRQVEFGDAAGRSFGTGPDTVAAGNDTRIVNAVPNSRTISAGTGLTGGGDLSANRSLAVSYGTSAGTAAQGNDSRITGAAQKASNLSDLASAATAFANIKQAASTTATGVVELATAAEYRAKAAGVLGLSPTEVWDAAGWFALTDAATITVDMSAFLSLASVALGGNRSLGTPSNGKPGQHFIFKVTAVTSTRTLTLPGAFSLAAGVEAGPYSITTSETVYISGFVDASSTLRVYGVLRF